MKWQDLIKYSSVQLRKLDDKGIPCGIGSGCLFDLKDHRFLLTVFHVTQNSSNWSAQIKFNEEVQKFEALFLNEFSYFADYSVDKTGIENVDFSFHPVLSDFTSFYQNINWKGEILESKERPIFSVNDISEPSKDIYYGFSGDIRPTLMPDQNALETTQHIYHGLRFDRVENDMLYFKLPEDHPGHEMFQGCSGAPIIGEDGKVVSLVSGGCTTRNEIYGCNLLKCIRSLDYYLE